MKDTMFSEVDRQLSAKPGIQEEGFQIYGI